MIKNTPNRRQFLSKLSLAIIGSAFLSSQWSYAFTVEDESPFEGYEPFTKNYNDLRSANFSVTTLNITGTVYGADGRKALPNVRMEVWHVSPGSKKYDHRGVFSSNAMGQYSFKTDMPNRINGKLPRIYFKISHEGRIVYTELILNSHNAYISHEHWEKNRALNERLLPAYKKNDEETEIEFNLIN